jgi:CDP-glycerol glycerophosphotransferase (TagB/SpsB family)
VTGLAKSDPLVWFNRPALRSALRSALPFRDGGPLVLFAPTWGADGVLAQHGETVVRLCRDAGANLVVKLHSCSYLPDGRFNGGVNWSERMAQWAKTYGIAHLPEADLSILMLAADVMVADFGSAPVEFCLVDRPLVFFDSPAQAERTGGDRFQFAALCAAGGGVRDAGDVRRRLALALGGNDGAERERASVREAFFFGAGNATANSLRELYALMELDEAGDLIEQYRRDREAQLLQRPEQFYGRI